VSSLESEIDQVVYALYGLSRQEIEIIDGCRKRKPEGERSAAPFAENLLYRAG
jgi:hypothetical protein